MKNTAKSKKLTARQRQVLEFIVNHIAQKGFPPSIREIGRALGISSLRGVTVHLDALERKGWIERESSSRGIKVLTPIPNRQKGSASVPLLGTIAAGIPIPAIENVESYVLVPEEMAGRSGSLFALRVKGDSMTGDAILPGDIVIIRSQRVVANGELAAVLIDNEATVKRVHTEQGKMLLLASNPNYDPIVIQPDESRIIGKVVGLIRNY